jgi:hypothetical protein
MNRHDSKLRGREPEDTAFLVELQALERRNPRYRLLAR